VPGVVDAALDAQEAVQVNPVGAGFSVFPTNAVFPSRSESDPFDSAQKIDAVRRYSQLKDFFIRVKIEKIGTSKFGKRNVRPLDVLLVRINPEVHILGVTRFCVIDKSEAADDQVPDAVLAEYLQQVLKVLDSLHRC